MKLFKKLFILFMFIFMVISFSFIKTNALVNTELVEYRNINSKSVLVDDGKIKTFYYSTPVHYLKDLSYYDFDNSFYNDGFYLNTNSSNYCLKAPINLFKNKLCFSYLNLFNFNLDFNFTNNSSLIYYTTHKDNDDFYNLNNISSEIEYLYNDKEINIFINPLFCEITFEIDRTFNNYSFSIPKENIGINFTNDEYLIKDLNGNCFYELNLPKIVYKDGTILYPELLFESDNNNYTFDVNFSEIDFNNEPLYMITLNNPLQCDYKYIRDKYVNQGYSGFIDNNDLYVGVDPMVALEGNSLVNYNHIGFIEINIPYIHDEDFVSAEIYLSKKNISNNINQKPDIHISYVTNKTYDDITSGTVSYSKTLLDNGLYNAYSYTLDISNGVEYCLLIDNGSLLLVLTGTPHSGLYGVAIFNTANEQTVEPSYSITTTQNITSYTFGNAGGFNYVNNPMLNCFDYAIGAITPYNFVYSNFLNDDNDFINIFVPYVLNYIANNTPHNFPRVLSNMNSPIFSNERRIALRCIVNAVPNLNYHFIKQLSSGSWASKMSSGASENLYIFSQFYLEDWFDNVTNLTSSTAYIAI